MSSTSKPSQPRAVELDLWGDELDIKKSGLNRQLCLDGIIGIGSTWNILSLATQGCTRLEINPLVMVYSRAKIKGFPELNTFGQILSLKLGRINGLELTLLMCCANSLKRSGDNLTRIRRAVIEAIKISIDKLPDCSITKRDNALNIDDELSIHDQVDWEKVGQALPEEVKKKLVELENKGERTQPRVNEVFFTFEALGQEIMVPNHFSTSAEAIKCYFDNVFIATRPDQLHRIILHCAVDRTLPEDLRETHIIIPNTFYISNQLKNYSLSKYYPVCGIPQYGNIKYKFPVPQKNIHAFQAYLRWTNYTKYHPYKFFRESYMAENLARIAENRFKFTFQQKKEKFKKLRLEKEKNLLDKSSMKLVKDLLDILDASVEVRFEGVHSRQCLGFSGSLGDLISGAFAETEEWLMSHKLDFTNEDKACAYFLKSDVMNWANYHILPCVNTIENIRERVALALSENEIIKMPSKTFWSSDDYKNLMAAEAIVTYFLHGTLRSKSKSNIWSLDTQHHFGLDIKNAKGELSLKNFIFDPNGTILCESIPPSWTEPSWITSAEIMFLKEIILCKEKLDKYGSLTLENKENLCKSILGYALSHKEEVPELNEKLMETNGRPLDECIIEMLLEKSLKNSYFRPGTGFRNVESSRKHPASPESSLDPSVTKILLSELKEKSTTSHVKESRNQVDSKITVLSLEDFFSSLLCSGESGKTTLTYVINQINEKIRLQISDWDMKMEFSNYWTTQFKKNRYKVPIVYHSSGGHHSVAIPYGVEEYEACFYRDLLKATYLRCTNRFATSDLEKNEDKLFMNFSCLFRQATSELRVQVKIDNLFKIFVHTSSGEKPIAEIYLAELKDLFQGQSNIGLKELEQLVDGRF